LCRRRCGGGGGGGGSVGSEREGDTNGDNVGGESDVPLDGNAIFVLPINAVSVRAVALMNSFTGRNLTLVGARVGAASMGLPGLWLEVRQ